MIACMDHNNNQDGFSDGFNFNARFPFRLSSYQAATVCIQDFRAKWGRWPTRGNCPKEGVEFSPPTFGRALKDLKKWEGEDESVSRD